MQTFIEIAIGIGLSAACGFRVFLPPLIMSLAAIYGHLPLSPQFEWIGTNEALVAFAIATAIEIGAYYIPWIDNFLDIVSTPTAIAVGTFIAAAFIPDSDPVVQWTLAAIAGGGSAGIIQSFMAIARLSSTAITVGMGNPVIATLEAVGAVMLSLLAIWLPILAVVLVAGCLIWVSQNAYLLPFFKNKETNET